MNIKICAHCKEEKELKFFYKRTKAKDGLQFECIECTKKKMKLRQPKMKLQHREYREKNRIKFMFWRAKQRAKKLNILFNISIEDIIIPEVCPFLGIKLTASQGQGRKESCMSLDRIIPELGYTKGNVQVISDLANRMKSNATKEQLITFSESVLNLYA